MYYVGLCVAFRPDGKEVVVATLDGQLLFFDVRTSTQVGSIEGRNDLGSGRKDTDLITAKKNLQAKYFHCYDCLIFNFNVYHLLVFILNSFIIEN